MLFVILMVVLVLALTASLPVWPHSRGWVGYFDPSRVVSIRKVVNTAYELRISRNSRCHDWWQPLLKMLRSRHANPSPGRKRNNQSPAGVDYHSQKPRRADAATRGVARTTGFSD